MSLPDRVGEWKVFQTTWSFEVGVGSTFFWFLVSTDVTWTQNAWWGGGGCKRRMPMTRMSSLTERKSIPPRDGRRGNRLPPRPESCCPALLGDVELSCAQIGVLSRELCRSWSCSPVCVEPSGCGRRRSPRAAGKKKDWDRSEVVVVWVHRDRGSLFQCCCCAVRRGRFFSWLVGVSGARGSGMGVCLGGEGRKGRLGTEAMPGFLGVSGVGSPARGRSRPRRLCVRSCAENCDELPAAWPMLNTHIPGDEIVRTIAANGEVSCKATIATGLVNTAVALQKTSPVASAALGRALVCTLLLSAGKKGLESVQLELRGDGELKGVVAISSGQGETRGYVGNPNVQLPPNRVGKLDVGKAVGRGILSVVRNHPYWKNPYTGLTKIVSGEIAEDVAAYLADSEQTPSALGAGVFVSDDQAVTAAGGFLVQILPGASEESVKLVERNVQALKKTPTELIRAGSSARDIVKVLMADLDPLEMNTTYPRYFCSCGRTRVMRAVALLGRDDVTKLLREQGHVEATCEFCKRTYKLTPEEAEEAFSA